MKTNLDIFKTNKKKSPMETTGVWFEIDDNVSFLLKAFGGSNSVAVQQANSKFYKPFARIIDNGTMPKEKQDEVMIKVFISSCLVDWKGVEIDGQIVDCSKEAALKLFTGLPQLCDTLVEHASDLANFEEQEKEDLGNS